MRKSTFLQPERQFFFLLALPPPPAPPPPVPQLLDVQTGAPAPACGQAPLDSSAELPLLDTIARHSFHCRQSSSLPPPAPASPRSFSDDHPLQTAAAPGSRASRSLQSHSPIRLLRVPPPDPHLQMPPPCLE